ncbi:MAG: 3-phosphoserine/phosphohydroxythreonine transaminase [Coriobacteriales bacterium]
MRVANFNAGPAALPEDVLRQAADEMLDYQGCGMSVMEMSHRSPEFKRIIEAAEADVRDLYAIPDNYRVLFMQGGGTGQFAAVPMNLMRRGVADYVVSGRWALKAQQEAAKYGTANVLATSEGTDYDRIPDCSGLEPTPGADYVYICANETVNGTRYHEFPRTGDVPLVADISSCMLSEPLDVSRFGLVWGGVQKNVGPAGVVIVIIRDDLVREPALPITPTVFDYKVAADNGSLYNTPPCWNIYMCDLVFKWLKAQGGMEEIGRRNHAKAELLYRRIDDSSLFRGTADPASRSTMNVTFTTGNPELDAAFVARAKADGLVGVKGHRSVGGMRASLYNAVTLDDVRSLIACMDAFERDHAGSAASSSSSSSSSASSI